MVPWRELLLAAPAFAVYEENHMQNTAASLLRDIRQAARAAGVRFELHRAGSKHNIWHLGDSVVLVVPQRKVPGRIRHELLRQCEPVLGRRWWAADGCGEPVPAGGRGRCSRKHVR